MDNLLHPSMAELYRLALHDAPYVVASYAIVWVGLLVYIVMVMMRMIKLNKEVQVLQDTVDAKLGKTTTATNTDSDEGKGA